MPVSRLLASTLLVGLVACANDGKPLPSRDAPPISPSEADGGVTEDGGPPPSPDAAAPSDAAPAPPPAPPPLRDDAVDLLPEWRDQVARSIDDWTLSEGFAASGYALPAGTELMAVRVTEGPEGRPGYVFYEAGDGAFSDDFWPASTVKLLSSIGALERVHELGFTSDAYVTFDSGYADTLSMIVRRAIRISSNEDYDRTVRIAGLTRLNDVFLTPERGFDLTAIQASYSGMGVTSSPGITFEEGGRSQHVPGYTNAARGRCPSGGNNCTTLFELLEGARRILLDGEIPEEERFALDPRDVTLLRRNLCGATPSFFESGATRALGPGATICHKPGWVPSRDCLDHGMIVDPVTGERIFLAAATPSGGRSDCPMLAPMAEEALLALADVPTGMALGPTEGIPLVVQLDVADSGDTFQIEAEGADRVILHLDGEPIGEATTGSPFRIETRIEDRGERLVGVQALSAGEVVGRRTAVIRL